MEELSIDNILSSDEIDTLFSDTEEQEEIEVPKKDQEPDNSEENKENKETTEVNPNDLFQEDPESVGSGDNQEQKEDTKPSKEGGSSPKNPYSSIAKAFKEDGIFPDLDDQTINNIKEAEDFAEAIEQQIQAKFDERQKRIDKALNLDIEPSEINKYEGAIQFLNSVKEEVLTADTDQGEELRKRLIYQDLINRGYSQQRAQREVKKSFDSGSDIEDAKEALLSTKKYYNDQYDNLLKEAEEEQNKEKQRVKEENEKLKKSILEDKEVFGDLVLDKSTRQKIYDTITKPVYKDPETGQYYTAIQKYEMENKQDFFKKLGLLFTLTDGFKDLTPLIKGKVNKAIKKSIRELETTLNNTSVNSDGTLNYISGVSSDPESFIGKGWSLDA